MVGPPSSLNGATKTSVRSVWWLAVGASVMSEVQGSGVRVRDVRNYVGVAIYISLMITEGKCGFRCQLRKALLRT